MAKANWNEYSATPASNTVVDDVNINEGCPPSGINNAIRELMAHTADVVAGTVALSTINIDGGSITGITDLAVADGGTGSSTASGARANISAAALGANSDITSITGLTTPLAHGQGGIGLASLGTANQVLAVNSGASALEFQDAAVSGGYNSMQVFTSSGTWTRPSGITKVMVIVTAGGGGGGGTPNDSTRGGGAGGGTAIETIDVSSTSSAAVTVGAAGAAGAANGNDGGAGGASSFASFCSATGGAGGEGSTAPGSDLAATAGGTGSGGDINLKGGDAYYFARTAAANWGGPPTGGASYWGPGGVGQYRGSSVGGGTTGTYGSGGGGSSTAAIGGGYAGAAGGAGIVVVYEYK